MGGLSELSKLVWVGRERGKDHPLLVVGAAQHLQRFCSSDNWTKRKIRFNNPFKSNLHLVIVKVEVVSNAEPVSTLLTGKTLEVVNIRSSSHYHLKGRDHLWVEELSQI